MNWFVSFNPQLTLCTPWCNAFTFAILHFWMSANFEPTCQGPLVLLLFLSDVKGSHSPIDFFMSPGWRSDHGLAARRPNAQHMQRRENWEEMFPKSNVKTYIFCISSLANSKISKIQILGGCPGSVDHTMQFVNGEGWSSIPRWMGLITRVKLLNV